MADLCGSESQVEFHTNDRGNESDLHGSDSQVEFHTNARGSEKEAKCDAKVKGDFHTNDRGNESDLHGSESQAKGEAKVKDDFFTPPASPHDATHFRRAINIHLEALQSFLITQYEKDMAVLKEENWRLVQRLLVFHSASGNSAPSRQLAPNSTGEPCSEPSPQRLECLQNAPSSLQHSSSSLDPAMVCPATLQQFAIFSPEPSETSARSEAFGESLCDPRDSGGVHQDHKLLLEALEGARSFPLPSADAPASSLQHLSRSLQHENVQVDDVVPLVGSGTGKTAASPQPALSSEPYRSCDLGTQSQGVPFCYESENYAIVDNHMTSTSNELSAEQHKDNRKTPTSDELSAEQREESCSSKMQQNSDLRLEVLQNSASPECSQLAPLTSSQRLGTSSQECQQMTSSTSVASATFIAECSPNAHLETLAENVSDVGASAGARSSPHPSVEPPASSGYKDAHVDEGAGPGQVTKRSELPSLEAPASYSHEDANVAVPLVKDPGTDAEASMSLAPSSASFRSNENTGEQGENAMGAQMQAGSTMTAASTTRSAAKRQLSAHTLGAGQISGRNFSPLESMQGEADVYVERVKRFINSSIFEVIMGTVIICNIATIFMQLQWRGYQSAFLLGIASNNRGYPEAEKVFGRLDLLFNSIYLVELILRLWVKRLRYFCDVMGSIDAVVVFVCCLQSFILEPAQLSLEPSLVRIVRLFRLFRIIKIFRFMNQVEELRILLRTLSLSTSSLLWSMLLIGTIIIAAGVLMAQLTLGFIEDESADPELRQWVFKQYGSAGKATFSMFEGAFTGVWTAKSEPLLENVSFGYGILYICYVVTINFAMIRVISALFLKQTMNVASSDADERAAEKMHERAKYMAEVHHFFDEQDSSGDGVLDQEEFDSMLQTKEVVTLLEMLELTKDEAKMLFEVLSGEEGAVDYREFLDGAMKMRHSSRAVEAVQMLHEITVIQRRIDNLSEGLEVILDTLRTPNPNSDITWNRMAAPRRPGVRSSVCYAAHGDGGDAEEMAIAATVG